MLPPSAHSLVSLIGSAPALLWETDEDLRIAYCSDEAALGLTIGEWFSSGRLLEAHRNALAGRTTSLETEFRGRSYQATVKRSERGVIGIAFDVTERMLAERAFRISEHSFRSLIEDAPYAICQATVRGGILQVNRAMAEMLGYESETSPELLLNDLPFIFTPAGEFEAFSRAVLEQRAHAGTESSWIRKDGRAIRVWVSGRVVPGRNGEISHLEIFAEDITEKKRLEAEQGQAHKMQALGQLAGGVAHDFNNLLLVISGHVEMLLLDAADGLLEQSAVEPLTAVKEAAVRAAALTDQMLAFSRVRAPRVEPVDLNDLLRRLMTILTRLIRENIDLRLAMCDWPVMVRADAHEIERVVLNLAVNAQDAMPDGGRLSIRTSDPGGGFVELSVTDTGLGMDRETQARIFEPFFTARKPAAGNQGTGLGLSVVYGIVRQHAGTIRIESEPGAGSTFRIQLPRATETAPVPAPPAPPRQKPTGGRETILFAEDDAAIRRLLTPVLATLGYRVLTAENGLEALDVARTYPGEIHLLLTDVVMPGLGGPELAARLRSEGRAGLRALFISGYAGSIAEGEEDPLAGVTLLRKPFSMDLLAGAVRDALGVSDSAA